MAILVDPVLDSLLHLKNARQMSSIGITLSGREIHFKAVLISLSQATYDASVITLTAAKTRFIC